MFFALFASFAVNFLMLEIENLHAGYRETVLHDVSLNVRAGEIAGVIGPNGCGKSTLLRCVIGALKPTQGRVLVGGDDVFAMSSRSRAQRVALLPQHSEIDTSLLVREAVALGRTPYLSAYGALTSHDENVVNDAMRAAQIDDFASRRLDELSGGERQRVGLARALAQATPILLLDEPTSNLDIRYQHELLHLVKQLARRDNLAVVVVLHQINLAAAVCDHLLLLSPQGRVLESGAPAKVMTPANLEDAYEMPLRVVAHPRHGRPQAQADWDFESVGGV